MTESKSFFTKFYERVADTYVQRLESWENQSGENKRRARARRSLVVNDQVHVPMIFSRNGEPTLIGANIRTIATLFRRKA